MFAVTTRSLKIAVTALALAVAGAAAPGAVTPAEAKKIIVVKKHVFHGHHHHLRLRHIAPVVLGVGYGGCHWMKVRAINLGSDYWWAQYHACRGF